MYYKVPDTVVFAGFHIHLDYLGKVGLRCRDTLDHSAGRYNSVGIVGSLDIRMTDFCCNREEHLYTQVAAVHWDTEDYCSIQSFHNNFHFPNYSDCSPGSIQDCSGDTH